MRKINLTTFWQAFIFVIIIGFAGTGAVFAYQMQSKVKTENEAIEEANRPADIELIAIVSQDCAECFDISNFVEGLKTDTSMNISKEQSIEYTSGEGVELVKKYDIKHVPALLIKGETEKAFGTDAFEKSLGKVADDGVYVVTKVPPVYVDVASGTIKGKFTAIYLSDNSCVECYDVKSHINALSGLGMSTLDQKFIDRSDSAGKDIIAQYKIKTLPTLLLTGDLGEYPQFIQIWPSVGTIEKDGTYVFRDGQVLMGAHYDLTTKKLIQPNNK